MTPRPTAPLPDFDGYLARWSALHGGLDPRANRWVLGWLSVVYRLAGPMARRRVSPDTLTLAGLVLAVAVVAAAVAGGRWALAGAALVLLSALADGLDGAAAALRGSARPWGAVLDALADRCADVLYLVALWVLGAPAGLCAVAAVLTLLQESSRASAAAAGMREIGVITVWERPSRVIVAVLVLLAAGVVPAVAAQLATAGAAVATALAVVGLGQLLRVVHRRLG